MKKDSAFNACEKRILSYDIKEIYNNGESKFNDKKSKFLDEPDYILSQVIEKNNNLGNKIFQDIQKIQISIANVNDFIYSKDEVTNEELKKILGEDSEYILSKLIQENDITRDKIAEDIKTLQKNFVSTASLILSEESSSTREIKKILDKDTDYLINKIIKENEETRCEISDNIKQLQQHIQNTSEILLKENSISSDKIKEMLIKSTNNIVNKIINANNITRGSISNNTIKIQEIMKTMGELFLKGKIDREKGLEKILKNSKNMEKNLTDNIIKIFNKETENYEKTHILIKDLINKVIEIICNNRELNRTFNKNMKEKLTTNFDKLLESKNIILKKVDSSTQKISYEMVNNLNNVLKGQENICRLIIESENKVSILLKNLKISLDNSNNNIVNLICKTDTTISLLKELDININKIENKICSLITEIRGENCLLINDTDKNISKSQHIICDLINNSSIKNESLLKSLDDSFNTSENKIIDSIQKSTNSLTILSKEICNDIIKSENKINNTVSDTNKKNGLLLNNLLSLLKNTDSNFTKLINNKSETDNLSFKELHNYINILNEKPIKELCNSIRVNSEEIENIKNIFSEFKWEIRSYYKDFKEEIKLMREEVQLEKLKSEIDKFEEQIKLNKVEININNEEIKINNATMKKNNEEIKKMYNDININMEDNSKKIERMKKLLLLFQKNIKKK